MDLQTKNPLKLIVGLILMALGRLVALFRR
jgi:hypothetical protein